VTLCPARGRTSTSPFTRHLNRSAQGLSCDGQDRAPAKPQEMPRRQASRRDEMRENRFAAALINCTAMAASIRPGTVEPTGIVASNPRNSMTMPNERCCKIDVSQPTVK
jgi:hypothetical protein